MYNLSLQIHLFNELMKEESGQLELVIKNRNKTNMFFCRLSIHDVCCLLYDIPRGELYWPC